MNKDLYLKTLKGILAMADKSDESQPLSDCTIGICVIFAGTYPEDDSFEEAELKMKESFSSWSGFSGDEDFPISSDIPDEESPHDYYMLYQNLWEGRQLEQRISLLKHLINVA